MSAALTDCLSLLLLISSFMLRPGQMPWSVSSMALVMCQYWMVGTPRTVLIPWTQSRLVRGDSDNASCEKGVT